ncbi:MAG: cobalamin biosynthesis protein [Scytonematopsis contorta HA4267-MV1]|jgi:cobalamin biosynthesis protein CbiG|nr:cobalamin biosynthesis protein [Scytonematopsis contorta HA4267-MV1]
MQFWVGIGCQKGTCREVIEIGIKQVFQSYSLPESLIVGIASIDRKAGETGLLEFCRTCNLPLKTFSADALSAVSVPNASLIVGEKIGTTSVAEAAALLAVFDYCSSPTLIVPKQVFRLEGFPGVVTLAVAYSRESR